MSDSRERFEAWYIENAFDYEAKPIGSRECLKQWQSWQAAERDALERAAKVCRERAKKQPNLDMKFVAIDCERDIRALAGKE